MKIRLVPALIMAGISLLAGYGFYAANAHGGNADCWIMMVTSAICLFVALAGGFCVKYGEGGSSVGIAVISVIAVIVHLIINLIATFAPFHVAPYIIFSGIILLIYIGIVYAMSKSL